MREGQVLGGDFSQIGDFASGFIYTDVADFRKALTSNASTPYGTDSAAFTQGRALQFESLEPTLISVIQDMKQDFPLYNALQKSDATSVVDQWTRRDSIGGFPGGETNTEVGEMSPRTGTYKRITEEVKFLMTMCEVSAVQRSTREQAESMRLENENGILRLITTAEHLMFYGNKAVVPTEFDGIRTVIERDATADHVLDIRGQSISPEAGEILDSAALIADQGNFGRLTDMYCSNLVKADFDKKVDPKHRVMLDDRPQRVEIGTPIVGVNTETGPIMVHRDIWIREGQAPFAARTGTVYPGIVTSAQVTQPASITATASTNTAISKFANEHQGQYEYCVEAVNKNGRSAVRLQGTTVQVNAGQVVTITIVPGVLGGGNETGYVIYRSRRNSTAGTGPDGKDAREMVRVARTGDSTVYVDANQNIPGTSEIFLLNMTPSRNAINLRRLLPLTQFNLATVNRPVYPWALLFFLYLRVAIPRHHRVIKNVLPSGSVWRPF